VGWRMELVGWGGGGGLWVNTAFELEDRAYELENTACRWEERACGLGVGC
jgi:hypothetical protein